MPWASVVRKSLDGDLTGSPVAHGINQVPIIFAGSPCCMVISSLLRLISGSAFRKAVADMGLFRWFTTPQESATDSTGMVNTYANQMWLIPNKREVLLLWRCAPDHAGSQQDIPLMALAVSYFTAKRMSMALTNVVHQHEEQYGTLDSEGSPELPRQALAQPAAGANFCTVSVTPEELILDFGMNTQVQGQTKPVKFSTRLVLSFVMAKHAMAALCKLVEDYERRYGVIELDFQKRARRMH